MQPLEAIKPESWASVKLDNVEYRKDFKSRTIYKFMLGDSLLIPNESKTSKINDDLNRVGLT